MSAHRTAHSSPILDLRPTSPALGGLWLRLYDARVNEDGQFADDVRDWRLILNYELPLL